MFNVNGETYRAEIEWLRMYLSMGQIKKKKKHLKFLVPNTNGPFVGNPVSIIYECLFFFYVKMCCLFNNLIKMQIKAHRFFFFAFSTSS